MLNNANLEIARQFVWTMSRLKVNYFPTQASLYRAIETIKFPNLNRPINDFDRASGQAVSEWRNSVSPGNRTKNVNMPKNYRGIIDFLIGNGFLVVYYTWIKNGNVRQRAYAADFKISGIRSEIGEITDSTELWKVTPEIVNEYKSWSKLSVSARFPVMDDIDDSIKAHKSARAKRKQKINAKRKQVVETKYFESNYDFKFATGVQVPQSVLSLTREELQELYYLVGIGKMHAQLANESVAEGLMDKIGNLICSK